MEKEKAVTNTNFIIFIAKIDVFHLLKNKFSQIFVTNEVINEIFRKDSKENLIIAAELGKFLRKVNVKEIKKFQLDEGENSAISYCLENKINTFLSDDKEAREMAEYFKLKAIGVLGILLWNLQYGFINKDECKNLLKKLIENGYYITTGLYDDILSLIDNY